MVKIEWDEGWPFVEDYRSPTLELNSQESRSLTDELIDFNRLSLNNNYQSLRIPIDNSWLSYQESCMILIGRESLSSLFEQSFVARRVQSFNSEYSCKLSFNANSFLQMSGLVVYYNTGHFYYLHLSCNNRGEPILKLIQVENYEFMEVVDEIVVPKTIHLKAILNYEKLSFCYSLEGKEWRFIAENLDSSILSDDYVREGGQRYRPAFTGMFFGVNCIDLSGSGILSKFEYLHYKELV